MNHLDRFTELKRILAAIAPEADEWDVIHAASFLNKANVPKPPVTPPPPGFDHSSGVWGSRGPDDIGLCAHIGVKGDVAT